VSVIRDVSQSSYWILIVTIWTAATACALAFAALTEIGPVVLAITRTHGVHLGDLVAAAAGYGGAALLSSHLRRHARPVVDA
jgi:hypothetical protein